VLGRAYFYTRDHLGSVRELTTSTGTIAARYDYDPYGVTTLIQGTNLADFQYAGMYVHQPSGYYLSATRAYSPNLGRWITKDPIQEKGGLNMYAYCGNNPVNAVDPSGLGPMLQGTDEQGEPPLSHAYYLPPPPPTPITGFYNAEVASDPSAGQFPANYLNPFFLSLVMYGHENQQSLENTQATINTGLITFGLAGGAAGFIGDFSAGVGTGESASTCIVSRWGRPGLQPGDFVMRGGPSPWNYFWSGKWQPGLGNQFAPLSSGQAFTVPVSSVGPVSQAAGATWADQGAFGAIKNALGQASYNP
jgi:RHS repeat-associated protein